MMNFREIPTRLSPICLKNNCENNSKQVFVSLLLKEIKRKRRTSLVAWFRLFFFARDRKCSIGTINRLLFLAEINVSVLG